jgi:DNA-binding transcriptional MerR regulator
MTGWAKIRSAAAYAGVSPRTLRKWLQQGLRHSRLPSGTIIISLAAIDEFLSSFEVETNKLEQIVDEIAEELMK